MTTWADFLEPEIQKKYFQEINDFVLKERCTKSVFPSKDKVFRIFEETVLNNIKVCIIGQDPYHTVNAACGVAFGVSRKSKIPPSLKNIFIELGKCTNNVPIIDTELVSWCRQGVFLINTTLTVEEGKPFSHGHLNWHVFVKNAIREILKHNRFIVCLAWGIKAKKMWHDVVSSVDFACGHALLACAHPSPFSARGFLGCNHFIRTNDILTAMDVGGIQWKL